MPIFSDSPVCMFITMKKYVDNPNAGGPFKEQLIPHFVDIVMQELDRMGLVRDRKWSGAATIQNFDKKGSKFQFFPELNDFKVLDGRSFTDVCAECIKNKDYDALYEYSADAINVIMDSLYQEFINNFSLADLNDFEKQLKYLKIIDKSLTDAEARQELLAQLENYFWNSTFATSQIIEMTTTDLAYYKNPVDFQKRFKEVYAAGNRLNTNTKYGRKVENTIYIADTIQTASRYTGLKKALQNGVNEGWLSTGQMEWILDGAKNINVADAQAFRNPYAFRAILDMMGKWNDEMEESFNRLLSGKYEHKDLSIIYQTVKPFLFTNDFKDSGVDNSDSPYYGRKIRVPHQNKNSEFLVLAFYDLIAASLGESDFLKGMGKFFAAHPDVDVIQFESAVKAGGQGIINLNYNAEALTGKVQSLYEDGTLTEKDFNSIGVIDGVPVFEDFKKTMDKYLDEGKLSQDAYNDIMSDIEPTDGEVFDALEAAIAPKNEDGTANL